MSALCVFPFTQITDYLRSLPFRFPLSPRLSVGGYHAVVLAPALEGAAACFDGVVPLPLVEPAGLSISYFSCTPSPLAFVGGYSILPLFMFPDRKIFAIGLVCCPFSCLACDAHFSTFLSRPPHVSNECSNFHHVTPVTNCPPLSGDSRFSQVPLPLLPSPRALLSFTLSRFSPKSLSFA